MIKMYMKLGFTHILLFLVLGALYVLHGGTLNPILELAAAAVVIGAAIVAYLSYRKAGRTESSPQAALEHMTKALPWVGIAIALMFLLRLQRVELTDKEAQINIISQSVGIFVQFVLLYVSALFTSVEVNEQPPSNWVARKIPWIILPCLLTTTFSIMSWVVSTLGGGALVG